MKSKLIAIVTLFLGFTTVLLAQTETQEVPAISTIPAIPATAVVPTVQSIPSISSIVSDVDARGSRSYSYVINSDDKDKNVNISVRNDDDIYRLKSTFSKVKSEEVLELVMDEMGEELLIESKGAYRWGIHHDRDLVYDVKLTDTQLDLFVDKELASNDLVERIMQLGDDFGEIFIDVALEEADRAMHEADQAIQEAERVYREADRMEAEAERLRESVEYDAERLVHDAERLVHDAERLEHEAERLRGEAERLELEKEREKEQLKREKEKKKEERKD